MKKKSKMTKQEVKRTIVIPASALILTTLVGCSDPSVRYVYSSLDECSKDYLATKCRKADDLHNMYFGPNIPESVIKKTQLTQADKDLLGKTSQSTQVPTGVLFVEKNGNLFRRDAEKGTLVPLTDEEHELVQYEYKTAEECKTEWNESNCKPEKVEDNGQTKTVYRSNPFLNYFIISRMMNFGERSYTSSHVSSTVGSKISRGTPMKSSFRGVHSSSAGFSGSKSISRGGFGRSYGGGRSFGG